MLLEGKNSWFCSSSDDTDTGTMRSSVVVHNNILTLQCNAAGVGLE